MNTELLKDIVTRYPEDIMYPFINLLEPIGYEGIRAVAEEFGGSSIYIPTAKTIFYDCITMQIKADYNGANVRELCKTYGFCEKTIRSMLKR